MRILAALLVAFIAPLTAKAAPAEIDVVTLQPGRVIAIAKVQGGSVQVTIYNLSATVAVNKSGKPMRNVDLPTALAYAKAAGIAP